MQKTKKNAHQRRERDTNSLSKAGKIFEMIVVCGRDVRETPKGSHAYDYFHYAHCRLKDVDATRQLSDPASIQHRAFDVV